ncbi:putative aldo-keto reductase [Xylariaceae sp. FL0804]|nr:putative aldo-keto reductase [Xylariaceae sp. FL0804]
MPKLLYGTAWKKDATKDLVLKALKAGFRGIDTAAQPRHYNERLVGEAVKEAISSGIVKREELFIQTKFTSVGGQDPKNLPYDPKAPLEEQVHASVASSLKHFATTDEEAADGSYIDSLVLHSPLGSMADTVRVWKALETYVPRRVRRLGISNTPLDVLEQLCARPDLAVRPACVQNRFYPATGWEAALRAYCRGRGVVFQSFWTLTGNPQLLQSAPVGRLAQAAGVDRAVALYALVLGLRGTAVLDGTTDEAHMLQDLQVRNVTDVFALSQNGRPIWDECLAEFKALIGEKE